MDSFIWSEKNVNNFLFGLNSSYFTKTQVLRYLYIIVVEHKTKQKFWPNLSRRSCNNIQPEMQEQNSVKMFLQLKDREHISRFLHIV